MAGCFVFGIDKPYFTQNISFTAVIEFWRRGWGLWEYDGQVPIYCVKSS